MNRNIGDIFRYYHLEQVRCMRIDNIYVVWLQIPIYHRIVHGEFYGDYRINMSYNMKHIIACHKLNPPKPRKYASIYERDIYTEIFDDACFYGNIRLFKYAMERLPNWVDYIRFGWAGMSNVYTYILDMLARSLTREELTIILRFDIENNIQYFSPKQLKWLVRHTEPAGNFTFFLDCVRMNCNKPLDDFIRDRLRVIKWLVKRNYFNSISDPFRYSLTITRIINSRPNINIRKIRLNHVLRHDRILYNVNNLYEDTPPPDYQQRIADCNTHHWIGAFHDHLNIRRLKDDTTKFTGYFTVEIEESDLKWMRRAFQTGRITGHFPHDEDLREELERAAKKYNGTGARVLAQICDYKRCIDTCYTVKDILGEGRFVRSERVSLKYGAYGAGPYYDMREVLISMVTTREGHICFTDTDTTCNLYFLPWMKILPEKEFRVFVYNNRITAISQQNLYSVNKWLVGMSKVQIRDLVTCIQLYFYWHIVYKMQYFGNYVMDLAITEEEFQFYRQPNPIYFIEPNSFGAEYAAGSALFHWHHDDHIIRRAHTSRDDPEYVEFRYVYQ